MRLLTLIFICLCSCYLNANTVLITGANRGIGLEFAKQFANRGYDVIGTARDPEKAAELKSLNVRLEQLDVADQKSIDQLARKLEGVPIDILVNNAGVFYGRHHALSDLDFTEVETTFIVNSVGPLRVTQALLPNLLKGKEKKIVNISSQLGSIKNNSGGMYAYRASKAALNQINRTMAIELGPKGFTCLAIHPGWVQTDMGGEAATYTPEKSVNGMIKVIMQTHKHSNGNFYDHTGNTLPW